MLNVLFEAAPATETQQGGSMLGMDFMLIFNIFIAVYLLYYAIKGTGKIYENDYPKEMKEVHDKFLRKFCWIVGAGMLVLGILELSLTDNMWVSIVSMVFVLAAIVAYFIFFRMRFKSYFSKKK